MRPKNSRYMKIFGIDDVLVGAAISGLGSVATNMFNSDNVDKTNQANALQAQMNRDFQERMSNTAYQRGMSDMKAAGLNPILAYQKGGASSPSGSQATMQPFEIKGNPASDAVNSGMALKRQMLENANTYATNFNIQADTEQKDANSAKAKADAIRANAETAILGERLGPAKLDNIKSQIDREIYENSAGRLARKTGTAAEEVSRTTDPVINSASKLLRGYNDTRTRRSTSETTRDGAGGSFNERFHY